MRARTANALRTNAANEPPDPGQLRAVIPRAAYAKETLLPLALFAAVSTLYAATWVAIFELPRWAMLAVALLNGLCVGVLFVIGHDAGHGSFLRARWLNRAVGRLAFLPSLHSFSFWDVVHNQTHHAWTNLKGKDYVWAPFSKEEFDRLGPWRRWVEQAGRTLLGVALHYIVVIWWPRFAFPSAEDRRAAGRAGSLERVACALFLVAQLAVGFGLAWRGGASPAAAVAIAAGFGVAIPYAVYTWLMGLVTFLHHNHERVRWYDRRDEWSFAKGSLLGTVHVIPGPPVDQILLHIMFHTAHHVDTRIPLYHLPEAQRALEEEHGDRVIQTKFTLRTALDTFRHCKLYDYRDHVWLDFAGYPTTSVGGQTGTRLRPMSGEGRSLRAAADATLTSSGVRRVQKDAVS
jgi:omega-6 fatty acid desaturase (delta-12 desaturase)